MAHAQRLTRKQREEQELEDQARDLGRTYYRNYPDLMLIEVGQEAARRWAWNRAEFAFMEGYIEARKQHEAYLTEKRS